MLNHNLTVDNLDHSIKRTFIGGRIRKRMLSPQTMLYKFSGNSLVSPNGTVSPWWSAVEPIESGDTGLEGLLEYAARLNVAPNDYARARSAVTKQWNSLAGLLIVRLTVPVFAFVGQCSAQPVDNEVSAPRKVLYIGGAWQLYIPNLNRDHVLQVALAAV